MDLDIIASVSSDHIIGNCLCVLGDAMAMPVGLDGGQVPRRVRGHIEERAPGAPTWRTVEPAPELRPDSRSARVVPRPEVKHDHLLDRRSRGDGAREHDARRRRQARRRRDPRLLLRAQARQPGRRLPHVPGGDRGHPQAADRLLDAGQGRDGRAHPDRTGARGPGGRRRVPAHQPPARLPGLRQGRRVPAAGHLLRLGRRALALHRAQAPLPEAAGAQPADRHRPRALHPLLPLRALLAGDRRGLPARPAGARRRTPTSATFDGHPYVAPFSGNIIELCPVGALTSRPYRFRARPWDIEQSGSVCTMCPASATSRSPSATTASCACWPATTTRSTTAGCATSGRFAYQAIHVDERITSPMVRDGGELRPVSWERALEEASKALGRAQALGRRAGRLPAPPTRRASCCSASCARPWTPRTWTPSARPSRATSCVAIGDPGLQATVPDLEFAHAVLVLDTEPVDDMAIVDLRIRKGVRRNRVKLAVASARPSSLDANAALTLRFAPGGGARLRRRPGRGAARGEAARRRGAPGARPAARRRRGHRDRRQRARRRRAGASWPTRSGCAIASARACWSCPPAPTAAACARSACCPTRAPAWRPWSRPACMPPRWLRRARAAI